MIDHRSEAVVKLKPEKCLRGIRTHDCNTVAVLYQLSYRAIWELVIF